MSIMTLPYTNLHEINLDWIIEEVKKAKEITENVYSPENPPPYPVRTVNGQTGDVTIIIPVNSVNGKTGSVVTPFINPGDAIQRIDTQSPNEEAGIQRVLNNSGIVTLRVTHTGTMPEAYIRYSLPNGQNTEYRLVTLKDIPESSGVVSINGMTGVVVVNGANLIVSNTDNRTIAFAIDAAEQQLANQLDRILVNEDDINYIERGIAILATNNTHAAVTTGQFVFVKSHPNLTPGVYVATANIATNEALTSNNLSTVPNGGLNALKTNIDTLNSNIANIGSAVDLGSHQGTGTFTLSESIKNFRFIYIKIGYYASGNPQFGQALIPVSRIPINSSESYSMRIVTFDSTAGSSKVLFTSETVCNVLSIQNDVWYTAISGIK